MNTFNQIKKEELKNTILSNIGKIVYIKYLNGGTKENTIYTYAVVSGIESDHYLRCILPVEGGNAFCYSVIALDTIEFIATNHTWYREPEKTVLYGEDQDFHFSEKKIK